jgi:hypothetical protein
MAQGALTIHDLLSFQKHDQLTKEQFNKAFVAIRNWLPTQSMDTQGRYKKSGIYIREQDLKKWHEMGLIDEKLITQCFKIVQDRDSKLFEKSQSK